MPTHENTAGIECAACGNGPIFTSTLTDTTEDNTKPPAPVHAWLADHGWRQDESIGWVYGSIGWVCGDHRP